MLCDNATLTVQQFVHNIVSPKFPAALSFLNLLEAPSLFGEYLIFFLMILKTQRAFDYFSQFKCCVKRASNYFCCFNGITINLTEERDRGKMSNGVNLVYAHCYSSLSTNHVGMPHQALI